MNIVEVTSGLRERILAIAADPSALLNHAFNNMMELEESYSKQPAAFQRDFRHSSQVIAKLWFDSLLNGTFPTSADMATVAETGRRRDHQGVPLASMPRVPARGKRDLGCFPRNCGDGQRDSRSADV